MLVNGDVDGDEIDETVWTIEAFIDQSRTLLIPHSQQNKNTHH